MDTPAFTLKRKYTDVRKVFFIFVFYPLLQSQNGTAKDPYHYNYCVNIEITKSRCSNIFNPKYATKSCHLSDSAENRQRHTRGMKEQDDKVLLSKNFYVLQ